jgi:hypothetical protein
VAGEQLTGGGASPRKPVLQHPWRVAIVAIVVLVVANLAVFLAFTSDTDDEGRQSVSSDVEQVRPAPGSIAGPEADVDVRLRDGLTGVLVIDGARIPEDQLEIDPATSTIVYRPGPDRDLERFEAGNHTVTALYWSQTKAEPPDPGTYTWSFRVAA